MGKNGDLKPKKIKGRIQVLKALPYKDNMVYIRRVDNDIFEYLVVFKNQIYSSYMVITPREGKSKLSKREVAQCIALINAGAESTIDALLGIKLDKETVEKVKTFESTRN